MHGVFCWASYRREAASTNPAARLLPSRISATDPPSLIPSLPYSLRNFQFFEMTGVLILRVSVVSPNTQNEEPIAATSNIQRAWAVNRCVPEQTQREQQHLVLDVSLFSSWCTMILDTLSQLACCIPTTAKRQVSLVLLVLHCLRQLYNHNGLQQLIYTTLPILLPGGDDFWNHVSYGWTTITTAWTAAIVVQWILCLLLGLRPRDALIACGILGALILDCVPFVTVVASLGLCYGRKTLPFEQCVALSVTLSCASVTTSMGIRRWVYSALSPSKHDQ